MSSHFVVSTGYEPKLACRTSATSGNKWLNGGDSTLPNQACFRAEQEQEQEKREKRAEIRFSCNYVYWRFGPLQGRMEAVFHEHVNGHVWARKWACIGM